MADIKKLEAGVSESLANLNNLTTLLDACGSGDLADESGTDKVAVPAFLATCRCMSRLIDSGTLVPPGCSPQAAGVRAAPAGRAAGPSLIPSSTPGASRQLSSVEL